MLLDGTTLQEFAMSDLSSPLSVAATQAVKYVRQGFALVAIPQGSKSPIAVGWNEVANAIRTEGQAALLTGNLGLLHLYSSPKTVAFDIDDLAATKDFLNQRGIDLDLLLKAPNAVLIDSGRQNRGKLLYRLPDDAAITQTIQYADPNTKQMVFEFRCASKNGKSVQDVLPPSVHPDTGQQYKWAGAGDWCALPEMPDVLLQLWSELKSLAAPSTPHRQESEADSFHPAVPPQLVQELRSALNHLRADDRDTRVNTGMALKSLGDTGRGVWLDFVSSWPECDRAKAESKWQGFNPTEIDYRYVFSEAQKLGWINPARNFDRLAEEQGPPVLTTPQKLPPDLKPVLKLDLSWLPTSIAPAVQDISDRLQCPPDYLAAAMICTAGSIVGNRVGICPNELDDNWVAHPALWGGIVGPPGSKKTPAINEAFRPIQHLEKQAGQKFKTEYETYAPLKKQYDADVARVKRGKTSVGPFPTEPIAPKAERFLVNDATYEALSVVLQDNPQGVMAFADEMTSLLSSLDREGQQFARGFYLSGWGGTSSYYGDRMSRGSVRLHRYCLSLFGGFQPDVIIPYVKGTQRGSKKNDGFFQRFQVLVWPDQLANINLVKRKPDKVALDTFFQAVVGLKELDRHLLPAAILARNLLVLHFDDDAQRLFDEWHLYLETLLLSGKYDSARQGHLGKYRSLIPALALLFHLLDGHPGRVCLDCLRRAILFAKYLKSHADRIYSSASGHDFGTARRLAKRLIAGDLPDGFTASVIHTKNWSGLDSKEAIESALEVLTDYGWVVPIENKAGRAGRPTIKYRANAGIGEALL
jgi:hypothetical protein